MSVDKYLSVITNFGCHYECPYCIVRENNLHIPKTTIKGLNYLKHAIVSNECNWVSVSGGGDPLHEFENHTDWYAEFFRIVNELGYVKTELHTSYINNPNCICNQFDRVVYHLRKISDIAHINRRFGQIVRVVFVVTENFAPELIDRIVHAVKLNPNIDELSFRQMVDSHYQITHYCEDYLRAGHKKEWYYIEQSDYNLYYCENKVSTQFEDFKKNEA